MSPAKVFGVVVRSFGLFILVYSLGYLTFGIGTLLGAADIPILYKISYFLSGAMLFVIALYSLKGAPKLIKFCYPDEKDF